MASLDASSTASAPGLPKQSGYESASLCSPRDDNLQCEDPTMSLKEITLRNL